MVSELPFKVFSSKQVAEFKLLKELDILIEDVKVEDVLAVLNSPNWWDRDDKVNQTRVFNIDRSETGIVKYVRDVRVSFGPMKFRTTYAISQFVTMGSNTVHLHCCEKDEQHLICRYRCEAFGKDVRVFNDELMSSSGLVVALGSKAIRTARLNHLLWLKDRVMTNKAMAFWKDLPMNSSDPSVGADSAVTAESIATADLSTNATEVSPRTLRESEGFDSDDSFEQPETGEL